MATTWTRADYDAATASDDAVRARDAARRARDAARRERVADAFLARGGDAAEADEVARRTVEAWDAASYDFDSGRTMVYDAAHTAEARGLDALAPTPTARDDARRSSHAASIHATPTTPSTPSTPTLLETLVAEHGVEVAFKIWAQRRRPSPCRPQLWAAQSAHRAAVEAEKDAVADAKEARLARRAAAATAAEARAKVALARAADARARV